MQKENEKLDVVYILGTGSKWADNELRYSLRSVEKYLPIARRVFIIGVCPKFLNTEKIHHIWAVDPQKNKLINALHKIRIACDQFSIGERFILMNDDFFFLKETREIPYYTLGTLGQAQREHKTKAGYYFKAIRETEHEIKARGIARPESFEMHYPIVIEKKQFLEILDPLWYRQRPVLFRSVYGNLAKKRGERRQDVKIYDMTDFHAFQKGERPDLVSTDNRVCLEPQVQKWLKEEFPEKSIYEK